MDTKIYTNYKNTNFTIVVENERQIDKGTEFIEFRAYEEVLNHKGEIRYIIGEFDDPYSNDELDFTDDFRKTDCYCFGTVDLEGIVILDFNKYKDLTLKFYDHSHIKKIANFLACLHILGAELMPHAKDKILR